MSRAWFIGGPWDQEAKHIPGEPPFWEVPLPLSPSRAVGWPDILMPVTRIARYRLGGRNYLDMLVYQFVGEEDM